MKAEITLGKEYDKELAETLLAILKSEGAKLVSKSGGFPGAEVAIIKLDLIGEEISVVSETYLGLSIEGEQTTIQRIADLVHMKKRENKENKGE